MPDYPPEALQAAAEALHAPCICSHDWLHVDAMLGCTETAKIALDAAAPILAEAAAQKMRTLAIAVEEQHAATDENICGTCATPAPCQAWELASRVLAGNEDG